MASPILSDNVQLRLREKVAAQRQSANVTQGKQEEPREQASIDWQIKESDELGAALSEAIQARDMTPAEKDPEAARAKRQHVIQYVAAVEAEAAEARTAADRAANRLLDLHSAAKAIWSPPPLRGETAARLWEAHDGPAPVRYATEAAAVASCRAAAARHRVLAHMVAAMEQEVRERHWSATGLSGPMLTTGIYADYRELINQSAQDDGWIRTFDAQWKKRAQAAERAAKANAGLDVRPCLLLML